MAGNRFIVKDYLEIAIIVSLTIVLGFFFYTLGRLFPFPGSKILAQAVFLGFMFSCILYRIRKMGTLTLTCFVFGGIMSFITIIMGAVILLAAVMAELIVYILYRRYHSTSIKAAGSLYTLLAFLLTLLSSAYITGSDFALRIGSSYVIVLAGALTAFMLGLAGSALGIRLMEKRLSKGIPQNMG